jgi:hypothetical protein
MPLSTIDQKLLQIAGTTPPETIDQVIAMMQSIDDLLPGSDGLKWFNLLYLFVTREVRNNPGKASFEDARWLNRLDVVFGNFYFRAITGFLNESDDVPGSWKAILEARQRAGIDRIQFALAGINAHINHDLALALLQTDDELHLQPSKDSPQHRDYELVNNLLEAVLPRALEFLATGILGELAQDTGKIGKLLAIWKVRVARDLAWDFADHLRNLSGAFLQIALDAQDKLTSALGRTLLLPLQ